MGGAPSRESVETSTGVWLTADTSLESLALNPRGGCGVGLYLCPYSLLLVLSDVYAIYLGEIAIFRCWL